MSTITDENTELEKALEYERLTAEQILQAFENSKLVCTECGAVYDGARLVATITTGYHLWEAKGYRRGLCPGCKGSKQ